MKLTKTMKCTFVYVVAFVVQADWLRAGADHDPLIIARVLASRYPENAVMSYIPALSWSGAIRLTALTDEGRWREKAQREMQPFISGREAVDRGAVPAHEPCGSCRAVRSRPHCRRANGCRFDSRGRTGGHGSFRSRVDRRHVMATAAFKVGLNNARGQTCVGRAMAAAHVAFSGLPPRFE
jgi:hypothetical protein